MLCLTRKKHESILIGKDIVVTVRHCGHGKVKLAIDAPRATKIVRGELLERDREQEAA